LGVTFIIRCISCSLYCKRRNQTRRRKRNSILDVPGISSPRIIERVAARKPLVNKVRKSDHPFLFASVFPVSLDTRCCNVHGRKEKLCEITSLFPQVHLGDIVVENYEA